MSCRTEFVNDDSVLVINCETSPDSQTIDAVEYSINGVDRGAASFPIRIPAAQLNDDENVIDLQLTGSDGSLLSPSLQVTKPGMCVRTCTVIIHYNIIHMFVG